MIKHPQTGKWRPKDINLFELLKRQNARSDNKDHQHSKIL